MCLLCINRQCDGRVQHGRVEPSSIDRKRRLPTTTVPVIARPDRAIQKLAQHTSWIIRSSRMKTLKNCRMMTPPDPRQREIPLDSLYHPSHPRVSNHPLQLTPPRGPACRHAAISASQHTTPENAEMVSMNPLIPPAWGVWGYAARPPHG